MKTFKLEEYLTKYEFSSPYVLCCSDVEAWTMEDVLMLADQDQRLRWQQLSLAYTEPHGHPVLRKLIAERLYENIQSNNVLCFSGAEEAIYGCLKVICQPSDHAIILTPCYQSLFEVPAECCQSVTEIKLTELQEWRIDIEKIKSSIQSNTKCIVINFPHNPTGQILTQQEADDLIALCRKNKIWLFSDEVYRFIGANHDQQAKPISDIYEKGVSLGVMSKAFGMPGLRVGWVACQNVDMIEKFKKYKDYLSICNSAPSELLAEIALSNAESILEKNNQIANNNLTQLDAFLKKYAHLFSWVRPQGGCIGFIRYLGNGSIDHFCHELVNAKGVLLMPASVYDVEDNFFRVGFGRKNFPKALGLLEAFLI